MERAADGGGGWQSFADSAFVGAFPLNCTL